LKIVYQNINEIIHKNEVKNGSKSKRVFLYGTHDNRIVEILQALGVFNQTEQILHFGVSIIFELHELANKKYVVKVFYFYDTEKEPQLLELPKCQKECSINTFNVAVKEFFPVDWKKECGN
jgi:hypothetical protein